MNNYLYVEGYFAIIGGLHEGDNLSFYGMEKKARREAHVDHAPQFRLVPGKYALVLPWLADAIRTDAAAARRCCTRKEKVF